MRALRGLVLICFFAGSWAVAARGGDDFAERIQGAGFRPDADGVAKYLGSLLPDEARGRKIAHWIEQLGSAVFDERATASAALAALIPPPTDELTQAKESPDPEIRFRARRILESPEYERQLQFQSGVLEFIRRKQLKGLAPQLLAVADLWRPPGDAVATRRALVATVRDADAELLRATIRDNASGPRNAPLDETRRQMREAAVLALPAALGPQADQELTPLLADREPRIRLAAARGLANLGRRQCLSALIDLLESDDLQVRCESHAILTAVTGEQLGYIAYDDPIRRGETVKAWKTWLTKSGETVALHFPVNESPPELGRILVCDEAEKKLLEIDLTGHKTFEVGGFEYIWGCDGQPDGHRLAVDYHRRFVVEYDKAGRECWRHDYLPGDPTDVKRLPSGNTLISLPDTGKVIELDRAGKIVWEVQLDGLPTMAQRLENGHTVVNLQMAKQVVELDADKKVVWRLTGLDTAHTAQVLDNGHVLVCEMNLNKAVEYDRAGKVVWSQGGFSNPAQAQRLANGHTLVADSTGLHEFDLAGHETWKFAISRSRSAGIEIGFGIDEKFAFPTWNSLTVPPYIE